MPVGARQDASASARSTTPEAGADCPHRRGTPASLRPRPAGGGGPRSSEPGHEGDVGPCSSRASRRVRAVARGCSSGRRPAAPAPASQPRSRRSSSSSSGSRRPSSPATSRPSTRATTPRRGARRHDPAGRGRDRAGDRRRGRSGRVRHQLGAADARPARGGRGLRSSSARSSSARRRSRSRSRTRTSPSPRTSRARRSAAGASATSPSCTPGCARPASTRRTRRTSTIVAQQFDMVAFVRRRDRRRPGDDLQRVRPGPRDQEPGDRQAVHARRPQRHLVGAVRHVDAPGRDLRLRGMAQASRATRTSRSSS